MYNLPGNPALKLTAALACGIFTGEITNWDDPALATLNPGLPNLPIVPVLRGDLAGTNYVFESWCITDAAQEWSSFYNYVSGHGSQFSNSDSPPIGASTASSAFPQMPGTQTGTGDSGTAQIVGAPDNTGYITYVEPEYAKTYGNKPVAFVENASGYFTQPTPENVAGALAYATAEPTPGIQQLNFGGTGCNVYNPSTYSYVLARTDGSYGNSYGQTLGGFLNYVLTIGEKQASAIDYASIGLALEQYGIQQAQQIPGDPSLTSTEQANFAAGDVTPSIVQNTPCGQQFQLVAPATTTTQAPTTTTLATTTTTQAPTTTTLATTTTTQATTSTTAATTGTTNSATPTTAGATATTSRATTATTSRATTATTSRATTATTSRGATPTTAGSKATVPPTTNAPGSGAPPTTGSLLGSPTTVSTPGGLTSGVPTTSKATGPQRSSSGGRTSLVATGPNGAAGVTTGSVATRGAGETTPPTSAGAPSGLSTTSAVATTSALGVGTGSTAPAGSGTGSTAPAGSGTGSTAPAGTGTGPRVTTAASGATAPAGAVSPSVTVAGAAVSASVTIPGGTPSASTGGQQVYIVLAGLGIAGAAEVARRGMRRKSLGAR